MKLSPRKASGNATMMARSAVGAEGQTQNSYGLPSYFVLRDVFIFKKL